jgi:hypothetical protein
MSDADFSSAHIEMLRLHEQIAGSIHELVRVPLPTDIDDDFRRLYDTVTPRTPLQGSAQRTFQRIDDIRQGLIAATYHQRNVAMFERKILQACQEARLGELLEQRVQRFGRLVFELLHELPAFRDAVDAVLRD